MTTRRTPARPSGQTIGTPAALAIGAGLALGGAALFNHSSARAAEANCPPEGSFVEIDGVRLHYLARGEGTPVVLIHGNGAMLQDWQASGIFDRLVGKYRVIAFDRPGCGHSSRPRTTIWTPAAQAELIGKAIAKLGIERPVVVGHSFGALVAAALAIQQPRLVAGLLLMSGYYFPTLRADTFTMSTPAIPVLGDVMRYTLSPGIGRLMWPVFSKQLFAPAEVPESFADFPSALALRPSQLRTSAADSAVMSPGAAPFAKRYGELKMPVSILTGDGDKVVGYKTHSVALHEAVPGSTLHIVPDAGHMVHYLARDRVIGALEEVVGKAMTAD